MRSSSERLIAVTGGTGFVGWAAAEWLRDHGWTVRAVVRRGNRRSLPEGVTLIEADLRSTTSMCTALAGCEAVVHAAGVIRAVDQASFDAVNVEGTRAVVAAANALDARLVLISSLAASGAATPDRPAGEDDEPRPLNAYGRSKLAGERVVQSSARVPWTIVRPPPVYGPRDRAFLPLFRLAARGVFVHAIPPSMPFRFIYIDDLARGIAMAAAEPRANRAVLYLAHPHTFTADELLRTIAMVVGKPYRPWRIPGAVLRAAALAGDLGWRFGVRPLIDSSRLTEFRAAGFVCSVERAESLLGFKAEVGLREGIERTAEWYRRRGWM